eukprot:scaffold2908_cov105-Isochrysis_galbana.AAC.7
MHGGWHRRPHRGRPTRRKSRGRPSQGLRRHGERSGWGEKDEGKKDPSTTGNWRTPPWPLPVKTRCSDGRRRAGTRRRAHVRRALLYAASQRERTVESEAEVRQLRAPTRGGSGTDGSRREYGWGAGRDGGGRAMASAETVGASAGGSPPDRQSCQGAPGYPT